MAILEIILNLILAIIAVILGGYILFVGRHALWVTLGIMAAAVTANLLAILVAGVDSGWDLLESQAWGLLAIAGLVGVLGIVLGRYWLDLAASAIGFIAGANVALWLFDIADYGVAAVAQLPQQTTIIIGLGLILIGGLLGLWLVRESRDGALILITMLVGTEMILDALQLNPSSGWTAIIILSLALAGVLVQYATYLREIKATDELTMPAQAPSSVAFFQDLELHE